MLKARLPLVLDRPDETWFGIELMHKDIRLAREAPSKLEARLHSAAVAGDILSEASARGYGHRDIAAIHELLAHA